MKFKTALKVTPHTVYFTSILVGAVSAFVCLAFEAIVHFVRSSLSPRFVRSDSFVFFSMDFVRDNGGAILALLLAGGAVSAALIRKWSPESAGSGVNFYIQRFHFGDGKLGARTAVIKFLATLLILSAGFPLGKEGPLLVIGAGLGAWASGLFGFGSRARRTLYLAGAAGCLGAVFHAPLGGAITAIEILYREDFESDALVPAIISSITAFAIFGSWAGFTSPFHFPTATFLKPYQLLACGAVGLLSSFLGQIFVWGFLRSERFFGRWEGALVKRTMIAAFAVAVVGLAVPMVLGDGLNLVSVYDRILAQDRFSTAILMLATILFLKMFLVGFAASAGCCGGTLVPSFMIGGLSGALGGLILRHFFPAAFPEIGPFVAVGMVGYFSTVSRATLGALFIVSEFTQSYQILPNLMIACIVSLVFTKTKGLYRSQLIDKFHSPAHEWDIRNKAGMTDKAPLAS